MSEKESNQNYSDKEILVLDTLKNFNYKARLEEKKYAIKDIYKIPVDDNHIYSNINQEMVNEVMKYKFDNKSQTNAVVIPRNRFDLLFSEEKLSKNNEFMKLKNINNISNEEEYKSNFNTRQDELKVKSTIIHATQAENSMESLVRELELRNF